MSLLPPSATVAEPRRPRRSSPADTAGSTASAPSVTPELPARQSEAPHLHLHVAAALRAFLVADDLGLARGFQRPAALALRVARAGQELAEAAPTDHHRRAALLALLVRHLRRHRRDVTGLGDGLD